MTKQEFLNEMNETLLAEGAEALAAENLRYYSSYIDAEAAKGRTEDEVLAELGSPRLIARSILDAGGYLVDGMPDTEPGQTNNAYATGEEPPKSSAADDRGTDRASYGNNDRDDSTYGMPEVHWLNGNTVMLILILILVVFIFLFWALSPILIPIAVVMMIIQLFRRMF